jgi:hypothetical protein
MLKIKRSRFLQALLGFGTLGGFGALAGVRSLRVDAVDGVAKVYRWFRNQTLPLNPTVPFAMPGWAVRDGAGLLWFDNQLFLMGGFDARGSAAWGGELTTNDVWSSSDGKVWTRVLGHLSDPKGVRWRPRHSAGWVVHNNQLFVVGGGYLDTSTGGFAQDVWCSIDGKNWVRKNGLAAPFNPAPADPVKDPVRGARRVLHAVGSYGDRLWLFGGQTDLRDPRTALNDLWASCDNGRHWQAKVLHNPGNTKQPSPRGMIDSLVEFKGFLWLCGGGTYLPSGGEGRAFYNDVWRYSEATGWERMLPNETQVSSSRWSPRQYHNVVVYDGKIWVLSGFGKRTDGSLGYLNDVWCSEDGKTWMQVRSDGVSPWRVSYADGVCASPRGIWRVTGAGDKAAGVKDVYLIQ